jgi:hypothetical protein
VENINYVNNSILLKHNSSDYLNENLEDDALQLKADLKKRKLTLLGLGSVYVLLILASFTFLT